MIHRRDAEVAEVIRGPRQEWRIEAVSRDEGVPSAAGSRGSCAVYRFEYLAGPPAQEFGSEGAAQGFGIGDGALGFGPDQLAAVGRGDDAEESQRLIVDRG